MTDLETRLMRALAADAAPESDPAFRLQVIRKRRLAALRWQLAGAFGYACLYAVLAALTLDAVDEVAAPPAMRVAAPALITIGYVALFLRHYVDLPGFAQTAAERVRSGVRQSLDGWIPRL